MLAEINVPRDTKAHEEAARWWRRRKRKSIRPRRGSRWRRRSEDAAEAAVKVAEADLDRLAARRVFAEKQYARVNGLVADKRPTPSLPTSK